MAEVRGLQALGGNGWIRLGGSGFLMVVVQCGQSGWDPRAGNGFVVEIEQSLKPSHGTSLRRHRVWSLLDDSLHSQVLDINRKVAQTLPEPDPRFLAQLPEQTREWYLNKFEPPPQTVKASDVWCAYYDESDAKQWADFLARTLPIALQTFLTSPPPFPGESRTAAEGNTASA